MYSVAAAAAATGLSETTVLRAIQAGRISGTKNEINEWQVDPADLHRLYSPEVTRSDSRKAPEADRPPARRSGRAEAISSRARLDDMAQARLSGLANSDQKTQQAARTRWWRLVTGLQDKLPLTGAAVSSHLGKSPSGLVASERLPRPPGDRAGRLRSQECAPSGREWSSP